MVWYIGNSEVMGHLRIYKTFENNYFTVPRQQSGSPHEENVLHISKPFIKVVVDSGKTKNY